MKRSTGTPVNLLPLLDVLLCTMGTLIVVLGVLNRLARTHSVAQQREDLAIAKEQVTLRVEQLTAAREKTIADLDSARRRLSGIEDHSRQLADKLKTLSAAARQLSTDKTVDDKRDALRRELNQLNADRAQLEKDLKTARNAAVQHKLRFSIVPFDGVYKTNRRPIYIECRGDSIILQPEGIVLTPNDFMGPPGPGNPLASALRAAQEYWSQTPPPGAEVSNDPYPLLLVRPNGIIAYYLARDAMASWNAEFGYELISADGKLDFPAAPEPRLVEMERRAVDEARQRLQWLAQVSPESFQRKQKVQYRVSAIRGGLVRDGAPSLGNDPFANDPLGGFGKSPGDNSNGRGNGEFGAGGNGSVGGSGRYAGSNALADARGNSALGYGGNGNGALDGSGPGGSGNHVFGNGGTGNEALGLGGSGGGTESGSGTGTSQQASLVGPRYAQAGGLNSQGSLGGGRDSGSGVTQLGGPQLNGAQSNGTGVAGAPGGTFNGSSDGATQNGNSPMTGRLGVRGSGSSASGSSTTGGSMGEGDSSESGSMTSGGSSSGGAASASSSSQGQSGMGSSSDPSQMASGIPSPSLNFNANQQRTARRLANERGRNWALQNNTTSSVPITRPIRIECWNDRLILVPDGQDQQPQVIPLADRTDEAVDQLVAAVRVHTLGWGLAGRSMYWKPQLVLDVKPSAESRANDLQVLLADSGLDVKRK